MIIYGSKGVHLNSETPSQVVCPNCQTEGSTVISVFRRHAHIFWIPLFPIGKFGASQCQNCGQTLESKEMPEGIKFYYESIKDESKGPIWQFIGLVIIVGLLIFGYINSIKNGEQNLQYLEAPLVGDVYEYKIEKGRYSTFKIFEIYDDSLYVSANDYEINKKSGINDIDINENYSDDLYGFSKDEILEMYINGEIFDVRRE